MTEIVTIKRHTYHPVATMGILSLKDFVCDAIERPWLQNLPFKSCIPEGYYKAYRYQSPKFGDTFQIIVPGRTFILFHSANWAHELLGCIALGKASTGPKLQVNSSRIAIAAFFERVKDLDEFDVHITQYQAGF